MTNLKIKDKDSLVRIFQTVSFIDSWRWNPLCAVGFIKYSKKKLTNSEKILTHWLCYITDRQMAYESVWKKGGLIFSELAYEYSRNKYIPKQLMDYFTETYKDDKGNKKRRFTSSDGNQSFASRYVPNDIENMLQTLEILKYPQYAKNIVRLIVSLIERYSDVDDLLIRIACGLHLLTYQLKNKRANSHEILKIISNKKEFEHKLVEFKKRQLSGRKGYGAVLEITKKDITTRYIKWR